MKIASEKGIELNELEKIPGSGRGGRLTKKDIITYLDSSAPIQEKLIAEFTSHGRIPSDRSEEMHHMRKLIANHMKESLTTSAHVYVMTEVDMTAIVDFVIKQEKSFNDREGFSLTYTPFIVDSVVRSLKDFPEMNSSLSGTTINFHKHINIGLAVAIENGLLVPNISNCEEKNFLGLARTTSDLAERAKNNKLEPTIKFEN